VNKIRRQSGVLVFLTPFLIVALAVVAVLAMDAARLYSVKADMQRVVNAAATAAADEAQACSMNADIGLMKARALVAARQVGFNGNAEELEVFAGVFEPAGDGSSTLSFTPQSDIDKTNAAVVRYKRQERLSWLLPEWLFPPVELSVNAGSRKELYAALSASASTLNLEGGLLGNLLGAVLGQSNYSLDPTSLQSLESTLLGVGDLLTLLGLADVTALLNAPLVDVLDATVDLVGGVTTPVGTLVSELAESGGLSGLDTGAVLAVAGDADAAKNAEFPLYDFIVSVVLNSAKALSDDGQGLINLSVDPSESPVLETLLNNSLLGSIDIQLRLGIDNPAPVVIGPARQGKNNEWLTEVSATDISLEALVDLELSIGYIGDLISALTLNIVKVETLNDIRIPLVVQVGGGSAEFTGAQCARGGSNEVDLAVYAKPAVANVETGTLSAVGDLVREPIHATILKLSIAEQPLLNVCVDADLGAKLPVVEDERYVQGYPLRCPDGDCSRVLESSGPTWVKGLDVQLDNLALDCGETSLLSILNPVIDLLKPVIETLLNIVTTVVLQGIISPLLMLLGVDLSGLNVAVVGADQLGNQLIENVEM